MLAVVFSMGVVLVNNNFSYASGAPEDAFYEVTINMSSPKGNDKVVIRAGSFSELQTKLRNPGGISSSSYREDVANAMLRKQPSMKAGVGFYLSNINLRNDGKITFENHYYAKTREATFPNSFAITGYNGLCPLAGWYGGANADDEYKTYDCAKYSTEEAQNNHWLGRPGRGKCPYGKETRTKTVCSEWKKNKKGKKVCQKTKTITYDVILYSVVNRNGCPNSTMEYINRYGQTTSANIWDHVGFWDGNDRTKKKEVRNNNLISYNVPHWGDLQRDTGDITLLKQESQKICAYWNNINIADSDRCQYVSIKLHWERPNWNTREETCLSISKNNDNWNAQERYCGTHDRTNPLVLDIYKLRQKYNLPVYGDIDPGFRWEHSIYLKGTITNSTVNTAKNPIRYKIYRHYDEPDPITGRSIIQEFDPMSDSLFNGYSSRLKIRSRYGDEQRIIYQTRRKQYPWSVKIYVWEPERNGGMSAHNRVVCQSIEWSPGTYLGETERSNEFCVKFVDSSPWHVHGNTMMNVYHNDGSSTGFRSPQNNYRIVDDKVRPGERLVWLHNVNNDRSDGDMRPDRHNNATTRIIVKRWSSGNYISGYNFNADSNVSSSFQDEYGYHLAFPTDTRRFTFLSSSGVQFCTKGDPWPNQMGYGSDSLNIGSIFNGGAGSNVVADGNVGGTICQQVSWFPSDCPGQSIPGYGRKSCTALNPSHGYAYEACAHVPYHYFTENNGCVFGRSGCLGGRVWVGNDDGRGDGIAAGEGVRIHIYRKNEEKVLPGNGTPFSFNVKYLLQSTTWTKKIKFAVHTFVLSKESSLDLSRYNHAYAYNAYSYGIDVNNYKSLTCDKLGIGCKYERIFSVLNSDSGGMSFTARGNSVSGDANNTAYDYNLARPGDRVCAYITADNKWSVDNDLDSNSFLASEIVCYLVVGKPQISLSGADNYAKNGFAGGDRLNNFTKNANRGSYAQYGLFTKTNNVYANGRLRGTPVWNFGSGGFTINHDKGLNSGDDGKFSQSGQMIFANSADSSGIRTALNSDVNQDMDYPSKHVNAEYEKTINYLDGNFFSREKSGVYKIHSSNLAIGSYSSTTWMGTAPSISIPEGKHFTLIVDGDVDINNNVFFGGCGDNCSTDGWMLNHKFSSLKNIPTLTIEAGGSIKIHNNVHVISGVYIARGGNTYTCYEYDSDHNQKHLQYYGTCFHKLKINGALYSNKRIYFRRTFDNGNDSDVNQWSIYKTTTTSEWIDYIPNIWMETSNYIDRNVKYYKNELTDYMPARL